VTDQPSLFGDVVASPAATPAARPAVAHFPPPPTVEWAKLITAHGSPPVIIMTSCFWTHVVREVLSVGLTGRWGIRADRTIVPFPVDAGCTARIVYFDPADAAALHRTHPMILIGTGGQYSARYRFALPGEVTPEELTLPPGNET